VDTVNGSITLDRGAVVAGRASNVNGTIHLDGAHVGGGLETVAGDIEVGADSRVEGGILVDKPNNGWFHFGTTRTPRVVIGPGAVVKGTLEFRREVDLYVSDRATIGEVKGATVHKFSGDQP
jgi:cytoskeletal protein CcmA (bactofilin family)